MSSFFVLVVALSIPLWLLGMATHARLMPGLPVSALMAFNPALAASMLAYRGRGAGGPVALLRRAFDHERITRKVWYGPVALLMPAVTVATYGWMRLAGIALPEAHVTAPTMLLLGIAFFVSALGEELGWTGYATDPLQARWGALGAGVLLGIFCAAWHVVPLLQVGRPLGWIAGWCVGTVSIRVLTVWLYNNTGRSVFATAVFHCTQNLCWQLFPNRGSHYDARFAAPILVCAVAAVVAGSPPRTLIRARRRLDEREGRWSGS